MTAARLLIATPVRGAELWSTSVSVGYSESVRALSREMPVETLAASLTYSIDNIRARNRIAGIVLREAALREITHVLWWDDDQWPEDRRIVQEMIDTGEDLIGAPYTNKKQPLRWVHQRLDERPQDERGLLEVRWVGFGFTLTSRACLERMTAAARVYRDHPEPHKIANLFGQVYHSREGSTDPTEDALLSEDNSFCQRWRGLGGRVVVYCRAGLVMHAGPHAWSAAEMPGGVVT